MRVAHDLGRDVVATCAAIGGDTLDSAGGVRDMDVVHVLAGRDPVGGEWDDSKAYLVIIVFPSYRMVIYIKGLIINVGQPKSITLDIERKRFMMNCSNNLIYHNRFNLNSIQSIFQFFNHPPPKCQT